MMFGSRGGATLYTLHRTHKEKGKLGDAEGKRQKVAGNTWVRILLSNQTARTQARKHERNETISRPDSPPPTSHLLFDCH